MAWTDYIGSWSADYVPANVIAEMRGSHILGIFFRLDSDPALHIWMGVADIPAGIDGVDANGTVYLGGGRLRDVPTLEVLVNGQAGSVDFGISGVDAATAQRAIDALPDVRGKAVHIGMTTLESEYYQPMTAIIPIWNGTASHTTEGITPSQGEDPVTLDLTLAVITGNATRSRPALSLWSDPHQRALYPTDAGCSATARMARGVDPAWPVYT